MSKKLKNKLLHRSIILGCKIRFYTEYTTNQIEMSIKDNKKPSDLKDESIGWLLQTEEGDVAVAACRTPFYAVSFPQIQVFIQSNGGPCPMGLSCNDNTPSITNGVPKSFCVKGEHGEQHWHVLNDAHWTDF